MSDPFGRDPHSRGGEQIRYSTPPFSPPPNQQLPSNLFPGPPISTPSHSSASSGRTQSGHPQSSSSKRSLPLPPQVTDEFGAYPSPSSVSGTSQTTTAARVRSSNSPAMSSPLPIPGPTASTSTSNAHATSHTHTQQSQTQNPRQRARQSHNPAATLVNASPPKAEYLTDEYVLHPSVWQFKQAHPRRAMVGFGPYVLLQTLGEGEFGKVKLGVHTEFGVEVAIKLIRRGSLEDETRASKVEREIDVLKTLKHPNIVRMFDVIDTEKYIGIVLEFAGGGELFDHILANRYLRERDAQKLFAQLISGVDYLHKKHIVHRDLKLENLLLDKHRNIIITDFGFANRFDHEQDDLMATSCGSPCYAAPELVVSEGLYVGRAVDIWSCGVILYAMLSGYLPYDDDPANPEGDNINLLYKYIMSTRLNFPDHISSEAKHLLQIMLVPNPEYRCTVEEIMDHPWLASQQDLFRPSLEEQEFAFSEHMYKKSLIAKRELAERRKVQQEAKMAKAIQRSQSSMPGTAVTASMLDYNRRGKEARHQSALPGATTMPEYLSNAGHRTPPLTSRTPMPIPPPVVVAPAQTSPILVEAPTTFSPIAMPSRPITPPPRAPPSPAATPRQSATHLAVTPKKSDLPTSAAQSIVAVENEPTTAAVEGTDVTRSPMSANKNRHTIQVEYDGEASYEKMKEAMANARGASIPRLPVSMTAGDSELESESEEDIGHTRVETGESTDVRPPTEIVTPVDSQVIAQPAIVSNTVEAGADVIPVPGTPPRKSTPLQVVSPSTPRASRSNLEDTSKTPRASIAPRAPLQPTQPSQTQTNPNLGPLGLPKVPPPKRERNRKGMSLDKFGLARILGTGSSVDVSRLPPSAGAGAAALQGQQGDSLGRIRRGSTRPETMGGADGKDKKNRRRTLGLMVGRTNSLRDKSNVSTPLTSVTPATPLAPKDMNPNSAQGTQSPPMVIDSEGIQPQTTHDRGQSSTSIITVDAYAAPQPPPVNKTASSNAAKKVMDWFRRKSLAKDTLSNLKTAGVRSDSTSSFVRVSNSPARPTPHGIITRDAAMSSTSSIGHTATAESTPAITFSEVVPEHEPVPMPDSATLPKESLRVQVESRIPLSPGSNKASITGQNTSASTTTLLAPSRTDLPVPSRSKSHAPTSTSSTAQPSIAPTPVKFVRVGSVRLDESKMRVHTGLVDQSALSSKPTLEVMTEVMKVLQEMGMDVKRENEFRLRCTRVRRRKSGATTGLGLGSVMSVGSGMGGFTMMGSASASKVDSRGLPMPSTSSGGLLSSAGGLKGMLMRRGSSYSSAHPGTMQRSDSDILGSPSASSTGLATPNMHEPVYGEHSVDSGDEVRFNVELCRIKNLPGLYLLSIKRLKGSVWSFKFIYQTVLERCETLTH